jgi:hypothetical protein
MAEIINVSGSGGGYLLSDISATDTTIMLSAGGLQGLAAPFFMTIMEGSTSNQNGQHVPRETIKVIQVAPNDVIAVCERGVDFGIDGTPAIAWAAGTSVIPTISAPLLRRMAQGTQLNELNTTINAELAVLNTSITAVNDALVAHEVANSNAINSLVIETVRLSAIADAHAHKLATKAIHQYSTVTERGLATNYQNTTPADMFVAVTITGDSPYNSNIYVNNYIVSSLVLNTVSVTTGAQFTVSALVPPGALYKVDSATGDTIEQWVEIRL